MDLDLEELAAVLELLADADFTEFRLQKGDLNLVVSRGGVPSSSPGAAPVAAAPAPAPAAARPVVAAAAPAQAQQIQDDEVTINAPMLGTFYRSPKPGEPAYIEVGDKVDIDTVVGIVEVMKLMSSVAAGVAGEVTRVLAQEGQLIEAGQPLFAVRATR